jgi:hypothetical protein
MAQFASPEIDVVARMLDEKVERLLEETIQRAHSASRRACRRRCARDALQRLRAGPQTLGDEYRLASMAGALRS